MSDEPAMPVKVAIIEDHHEYRQYLAALVSGSEGFRLAGSFGSVEEAVKKIPVDVPDIILTDIGLPGMSGIDGIRILKEKYPNLIILVETIHEDDERIFDALCAGATGYLLKKTQPLRIIEGLKDAISGGSPMSPEIARRVIRIFQEIRPPERVDYNLTPHEIRLLRLLVEGHNYKTAAAELRVTASTINFHLQKIYEKLQVHSKTEAVAKALRNRLI